MNDSETEYRANEQGMIVEEIDYLDVKTNPGVSNWLRSQPSHQTTYEYKSPWKKLEKFLRISKEDSERGKIIRLSPVSGLRVKIRPSY